MECAACPCPRRNGEYEVSFELEGFKKHVQSGVTVEAATLRSVEVTLEVGGLTETVQVARDAAMLNLRTPAMARSLSSAELKAVPTSTGSFTRLLSSEAGVSADLPPVLINGTGNISPSVNGTRTTSTSLFFNGFDATNLTTNEGSMSDNIAPAADTLEEVKLQTSTYDASTGRSGGGNFQMVTRSGRNDVRGTAHFNFQHEGMNSNDFFCEKDGIEKPKARRNEGGFTIGGPIRKNRFFFFGGYQRTDAETGFVPAASSITVLPQALQLIQGAQGKRPRGVRCDKSGDPAGDGLRIAAAEAEVGSLGTAATSRPCPCNPGASRTCRWGRSNSCRHLRRNNRPAASGLRRLRTPGGPWLESVLLWMSAWSLSCRSAFASTNGGPGERTQVES